MKVAILHQDLEWGEREIARQLQQKGFTVNLFDVRTTSLEDLTQTEELPSLVLNRVYASVANRDYRDNIKILDLLLSLERLGIPCMNSYYTSQFDYSKFKAAKRLKEEGVSTPETLYVGCLNTETKDRITGFIKKYGFPLIVKRDMGGRGKDLQRIENEQSLYTFLENKFSPTAQHEYAGGFVVQEFLKPTRPFDCRLAVFDGEFAFSYGRTLISRVNNGDAPWLASVKLGSRMINYDPTPEEVALAISASNAIGAIFNEVDMTQTEKGPAIIENNPTPNYDETEIDRVAKAVDLIEKTYCTTEAILR
ncbi:hypothetical protein CMO92_01360 [Candidatus Woesearchaeota archaeon]|nr:hypothetical protein [Candidatus Woesearchaeota archaeon]|tara:strand:+ start:173 stop:1096 length:924 start_codon:yes stop_codon:yes gene_type:complete